MWVWKWAWGWVVVGFMVGVGEGGGIVVNIVECGVKHRSNAKYWNRLCWHYAGVILGLMCLNGQV